MRRKKRNKEWKFREVGEGRVAKKDWNTSAKIINNYSFHFLLDQIRFGNRSKPALKG